MVEQIMYLAIGFLAAMLLALMIAPLVHNRAVRLTTKRLEAATPLSMAEIQADKDQLRAEFAMSARRLEMSVDQLKNKTTSQLAEIGRKTDAVNRLKIELAEKNEAIFTLEAREKAVKEKLQTTEQDFAARTQDLRSAEAALTEKQAELARINAELADRSMLADTRQVELVAVRTQIEELRARVGDAEKEYAATQTRLEAQRGESANATRDLGDARGRVEDLSQRVSDLDRQLIAQVKEAELLGSRVATLEADNAELRTARDTALGALQELRNEAGGKAGKTNAKASATAPELAKLRDQNTALEDQLRQARDERAKAQRELAAIQQQTESSWASERMENALLRERINDIAAEVAKLSITLEGPDSPIEAILAGQGGAELAAAAPAPSAAASKTAPARAKGAEPATAPPAPPTVAGGTLAERIRALQSHASKARQIG
jgi:myosin heavy subunit